jgi:quercetin dioxygenase-like cupin family protein
MAAPAVKMLNVGTLAISVFDFAAAGDVLPMHVHDVATAHITLILRGAVRVTTNGTAAIFGAGDILDTHAGQPHEFEALEPNTRITNIVKGIRG